MPYSVGEKIVTNIGSPVSYVTLRAKRSGVDLLEEEFFRYIKGKKQAWKAIQILRFYS